MSSQTFRDVKAWQIAYALTLEIYAVTKLFPKDEVYGLTSQMKRAAVSIPSNIAEGFGRRGLGEKDQFNAIAHGSLTELENQLLIAQGVGYIDDKRYSEVEAIIIEAHKTLYGLRKANAKKGVVSG